MLKRCQPWHLFFVYTTMISAFDIYNEFTFETSRSGGKGGQNVNKVESKVSLIWRFEVCSLLSFKEKARIKEKAKSYLCAEGVRVTSQKSRSQLENKENTVKKLNDLLQIWLRIEKPRRATKVPYSGVRKRLKYKKINSDIKKSRRKRDFDD